MILSKYVRKDNNERSLRSNLQSWWWRDLCLACEEGNTDSWFHKQMIWKVRTGNATRFWKDKWLGNVLLDIKYLGLYLISNNKRIYIQQVGNWNSTSWVLNLSWRRNLFEGESEQITQILLDLEEVTIHLDTHDKVAWLTKVGGIYLVKSAYDIVQNVNHLVICLAMEILWAIKAPPNALTIVWKILKRKVLKRMNLLRRGITLSFTLCLLCNKIEETTHHLFVECEIAYQVWLMVAKWVGIQLAYHNGLKQHLMQLSRTRNQVWKGV